VIAADHGERHLWLEHGDDPAVRAWVAEQSARTAAAITSYGGRELLARRVERLQRTAAIGAPRERGGRLIYARRGEEQEQPVVAVREASVGQAAAERVLIDPVALAGAATTAIDWWYPSRDGRYVVFGISAGGDENSTLRVVDVASGALLDDRITRTRYASLAWLPDESGFYYTRYAEDPRFRRVYLHRLGTPCETDDEIFGAALGPAELPEVALSHDGRWLFITVSHGTAWEDVYLLDRRDASSPPLVLSKGLEAFYSGAWLPTGRIVVRTTDGAANGRVIEIDPARPQREHWRTLVPEAMERLIACEVTAAGLLLHYLRDACSRLELRELQGEGAPRAVTLPPFTSVSDIAADPELGTAYLATTTFTDPGSVFALDAASGAATPWASAASPVAGGEIDVEQRFYQSRDGTRIPIFLVRRRGAAAPGPALLYGYGGFDISLTPSYLGAMLAFVEAGGLYAIANLRGGGEYGEAWHRAGMLERKQNVFDDFAAAADFLVESELADPRRLAIMGGSNGGLLVAAAVTQRPERYRAVVCLVPLTDMLRYQRFLIGSYWVPEYGDPDREPDRSWLSAYSPLHRVRDGADYPAILVATGEHDTRVDPLHARKFVARLQEAQGGDAPVLLRIETAAGHGQGMPVGKRVDERADELTFLFHHLEMTP